MLYAGTSYIKISQKDKFLTFPWEQHLFSCHGVLSSPPAFALLNANRFIIFVLVSKCNFCKTSFKGSIAFKPNTTNFEKIFLGITFCWSASSWNWQRSEVIWGKNNALAIPLVLMIFSSFSTLCFYMFSWF